MSEQEGGGVCSASLTWHSARLTHIMPAAVCINNHILLCVLSDQDKAQVAAYYVKVKCYVCLHLSYFAKDPIVGAKKNNVLISFSLFLWNKTQ